MFQELCGNKYHADLFVECELEPRGDRWRIVYVGSATICKEGRYMTIPFRTHVPPPKVYNIDNDFAAEVTGYFIDNYIENYLL